VSYHIFSTEIYDHYLCHTDLQCTDLQTTENVPMHGIKIQVE